jgi:ketosteroid isomerase-like protein
MTLRLPPPLGEYFAAANTHDADRAAAVFAADAAVHDERQDIVGREAIRTWVDETGRKYRHTAEVVSVEARADWTLVTAQVTGDFPGSPARLRYAFRLVNGTISRLEIG